jgi:hypothetical protein
MKDDIEGIYTTRRRHSLAQALQYISYSLYCCCHVLLNMLSSGPMPNKIGKVFACSLEYSGVP